MRPDILNASRFLLLLTFLLTSTSARSESLLQVLRNGGFEEDEMTFRGEPAASCGGTANDQWFNMQDRFPDGWTWPGVYSPSPFSMPAQSEWPRVEVALDNTLRHGGNSSLRLQGKKVSLQQTLEWNILTDLYRDLPRKEGYGHTASLVIRDGMFQDLVLQGWTRTQDVPADAGGTVMVSLYGLCSAKFELPKGTSDWMRFELRLSAAAQAQAAGTSKLSGIHLTVGLDYNSPTGTGQAWFDDLTLSAAPRPEPNLLPNPSFERVGEGAQAPPPMGRGSNMAGAKAPPSGTPYPEGWSAPMKWVYLPPPYYYVWNHWQHFFGECRGVPRLDRLVARSGRHSLRLDLLGGDEYALESPTITLRQKELRPIEATAWVKADRLRHLDFMIVDQDGRRLPTSTLFTFWGGLASGTHDWMAVRKVFQGYEPVQSFRLRIGARGFNGQTETDVGQWHAYNQVSTVWIDDAAVQEIYSTPEDLAGRSVSLPPIPAPQSDLRLVDFNLGERLFGDNQISAVVHNDRAASANVTFEAQLITPNGRAEKPQRGKSLTLQPGRAATVTAPYTLKEFSPSWRAPGRLQVTLLVGRERYGSETYAYGTWPDAVNVRPSKAYLDETENPILVAINLGLAEENLADLRSLILEVVERRTGKTMLEKVVKDIPAALAAARVTPAEKDRFYFYMPRAGLLDHRNLILQELDISALPTRPWDDPEADWILRVTGRSAFRNVFNAESHPFARLTKFDEILPPIQEVTIDPDGHFFRVNGKPFFLFAQSHANGPANGGAPASRSVSFHPERAKVNGLNALSRWSWVAVSQANWEKGNVYAPMLLSGYLPKVFPDALDQLQKGQIILSETYGAGKMYPLSDLTQSPWSLAYFILIDEAIIEAVHSPQDMKALLGYATAVRQKINRPIGIMDNHSQFYPWHDDDGTLDPLDALYFERESGSVFLPELTLRNWMKRKKAWVMCDLPQTYENVPHERERYRALMHTLHGFRGWFGIQGCADPSLYRGLGGEFRHIFTFLSALEGQPEVSVPEGVIAKAWRKGDRVLVMAEQHNPIPLGKWEWVSGLGGRAAPAHTGNSRHLVTPVKEGYAIHGYKDDLPREVTSSDSIRQEVYLSPEKTPAAIFLIVPGNGDYNHIAYWGSFDWNSFREKKIDAFLAGECYSHAGYGINWYRTNDPHWLEYQAAHRFPASSFVRLGDLPSPGRWVSLSVPIEKLNLSGRAVDGLVFMTSGNGLSYWGRSSIVPADGLEQVMLDGRIGRDPAALKNSSIAVAGLSSGTVRVVGENRSIPMAAGRWTDDLAGRDLFDNFGDGYLGDGITYGIPLDALPEALELGYTYDNSPRCIRVYEVIPGK